MSAGVRLAVAATLALAVACASAPRLAEAQVATCDGQVATIVGTPGDDALDGTPGVDVIAGSAGNDTIQGLGGNDIICGDDGDDGIYPGLGDDTIDGGTGIDFVSYNGHTSGVTASLATGVGGGAGESDSFVSLESLFGSTTGPDQLTGDAGPNRLVGSQGSDVILGGGGSDLISGLNGNDTIDGGSENDSIDGGPGDDDLDGGADVDLVSYGDRPSGVSVSLSTGIGGEVGESDTLAGFEWLYGSSGPDVLVGDGVQVIRGLGGNDTIHGGPGSQDLWGGDGNDTIYGDDGDDVVVAEDGDGDDALDGGAGIDEVNYSERSSAVTASLRTGVAGGAGESDSLVGVENLLGSHGPDTLIGDAGPNQISGLGGDDTVIGGLGDDQLSGGVGFLVPQGTDTVSYVDHSEAVTATLGSLNGYGGSAGESDTLWGFSNLEGGSGPDALTGDAGPNTIVGGDGDDALDGGADADAFAAGDGNDVVEARDGGTDSLFDCGPGIDTLRADSPADDAITRAGCELPAPPPPPPAPLATLRAVTDPTLPPVLPKSTRDCTPRTPSRGRCGDDQPGPDARLAAPSDVAVAADGSIVIADTLNNVIRLLRRSDGKVFTIAGNGARGRRNGRADQAQFDAPAGVAVWPGHGVLVADTGNDEIRLIAPTTGQVSTLVGGSRGPIRRGLQRPRDVLGLPNNRMLIADTGDHQVLGVSQGRVSVLAGSGHEGYGDRGRPEQARLSDPSQLAVASDGSLLIADTGNGAIRRLSGLGSPSPTISTVIRDLDGPRGVLDLPGGNVLVGDDSRLLLVVPGKRPITVAGKRRRGADGAGPAPGPPLKAVGQLADLGDGYIAAAVRGANTVSISRRPTTRNGWKDKALVGRSASVEAAFPMSRVRKPPPRTLFPGNHAPNSDEDYGDCSDARRFEVKLRPAGTAGTVVRPIRNTLKFQAGVPVDVVLELFHGKSVRKASRALRRLRVRRGTRYTRRLPAKLHGSYDAVLWSLSVPDREVHCDVRQIIIR